MDKIVVIGGGGHAKVIISILKKIKEFEITVYTDIKDQGNILGIKYLGVDNNLAEVFARGTKNAVIGIGQIKSSLLRKNVVSKLRSIGFKFPIIISPTSIINEEVMINEGTVIMDGVIINSGTNIGSFSIINTRASIDHDCLIGDYTHIAPGATLSGNVEIGNNVLIGVGASVIQYRKIVDDSIIAAGSSLTIDIMDSGTYGGIPARLITAKDE